MKYNKITISGRICTGKSTLYKALKKELGWKSFSSSEHFRKQAKKENMSINKAEEQNDEDSKNVDYKVRDLLKEEKNLLAEGWMTGVMAQNMHDVLRVLLICPKNIRYERYAKRENVEIKKARREIAQREKNLLSALAKIYNLDDILDPNRYNIVIDTSKSSKKETLEKILSKL